MSGFFEIALICWHFLMKFFMSDIDFQPREYGSFAHIQVSGMPLEEAVCSLSGKLFV